MGNIVLNVSIYRYATIEETAAVDSSWGWAYPRLRSTSPACDGRECHLLAGGPGDRLGVNQTDRYDVKRLTVATSKDMPHGSVFAQSSYFVRFWLQFTFNNGTGDVRVRLRSTINPKIVRPLLTGPAAEWFSQFDFVIIIAQLAIERPHDWNVARYSVLRSVLRERGGVRRRIEIDDQQIPVRRNRRVWSKIKLHGIAQLPHVRREIRVE